MQISIKTITQSEQRYDTTDDWQIAENGDITMYVSEGTQIEVQREIIHGLTECFLCIKHGITQKEVDDYDMSHLESDNPGENEDAPYHKEHIAANIAEHILDL